MLSVLSDILALPYNALALIAKANYFLSPLLLDIIFVSHYKLINDSKKFQNRRLKYLYEFFGAF